jgi:glycosidase
VASKAVREEIKKIMGFWLQLGVAGFRVDAAPFLIELEGISPAQVDVTEPYEYLSDMRDFLTLRRGDAILLAEANVSPHEIGEYFGDDDKLHMLPRLRFTRAHDGRRFLIALNLGDAPTALRPDLPERGTIRVGTDRRREGARVDGVIELAASEGVVVELEA